MTTDEFRLCNAAHRALFADLRRALRGYGSAADIETLALARLDFDGEPLDVHGTHGSWVPDHLQPLVSHREDVRAWAPKAPPIPRVVHELWVLR